MEDKDFYQLIKVVIDDTNYLLALLQNMEPTEKNMFVQMLNDKGIIGDYESLRDSAYAVLAEIQSKKSSLN